MTHRSFDDFLHQRHKVLKSGWEVQDHRKTETRLGLDVYFGRTHVIHCHSDRETYAYLLRQRALRHTWLKRR